MQDAVLMPKENRAPYFHEQSDVSLGLAGELIHPIGKTAAGEKLHAEAGAAIHRARVENRHDVWMVQARGDFHFRLKPSARSFPRRTGRMNDFQRNDAIQPRLMCL